MLTDTVFSKKQGIAVYRLDELIDRLEDERIETRHETNPQITLIRRYMLDNLASGQVYFPPLVARVPEGALADGRPDRFAVIDGTQRLRAMGQLRPFITRLIGSDVPGDHAKGYLMNKMLDKIYISVQLFEGFTDEEADQLYIDLNTKGKKVSLSKRIAYDSRNELNKITNLLVRTHKGLQTAGIEQEKLSIHRPRNVKLVSLSQLRRLVGYFMTGQGVNAKPSMQQETVVNAEEYLDVIGHWLDELFALHPAVSIGNYEVSMLANYSLLAAVAEYAYEGLHDAFPIQKKDVILERMRRLGHVDWNSKHPQWLEFTGAERKGLYFLDTSKANYSELLNWLRLKGGE
ncbi:DNA sulfur modification protein DndB [Sporosarcina koreensis]|uniref:DNA sulfur modification protein DndB n=1 Tax=Sporosarcina koreensis TaxID=334735 RepID=UPI000AD29F27|nr:DNA sulfur modification protein DndB [Sporosarcina koreensis]